MRTRFPSSLPAPLAMLGGPCTKTTNHLQGFICRTDIHSFDIFHLLVSYCAHLSTSPILTSSPSPSPCRRRGSKQVAHALLLSYTGRYYSTAIPIVRLTATYEQDLKAISRPRAVLARADGVDGVGQTCILGSREMVTGYPVIEVDQTLNVI